MITKAIVIGRAPAIVWGKPSDHVFIHVHGKMSDKQSARAFAEIADERNIQTLSFDLPAHGERRGRGEECEVVGGVADLKAVAEYARARWDRLSLFACSLGAYFSLQAYQDLAFENCLFQSPIVNMDALIDRMFAWFDVDEQTLREKKRIDTPIDTLSWDYYRYAKEHPVNAWRVSTRVLYAARDQLQSADDINAFLARFGGHLTIAEHSDHPFMEEGDGVLVDKWIRSAF